MSFFARLPDAKDIPLDQFYPSAAARHNMAASLDRLLGRTESFYRDIVIPQTSSGSRPLILQCEPFRDDVSQVEGDISPPTVRISFPRVLETAWEGETCQTRFAAPDEDDWVVGARLVDSIALFESGYVAYSVALVFRPSGADSVPLSAAALLALATIAEPAGRVVCGELRFALGTTDRPEPANKFLHKRLQSLVGLTAPDRCTVFSALAEASKQGLDETLKNVLLGMTFGADSHRSNTSNYVSIEVIGASKHQSVLEAAIAADERIAPNNPFNWHLSGLVQNVLDFEEQDESEIVDSLAGSLRLGRDITFAHKNSSVRFSPSSRPYSRMWSVIGGEPYWLLVDLIVGHNGKLLADLRDDLRRDQGKDGLAAMMHNLLILPAPESLLTDIGQARAKCRLVQTQARRIRLAHYIPNLFRYPTERRLYEAIVKARGIEVQRGSFLELESTMEKMIREVSRVNSAIAEADERKADASRNNLLLVLGIAQAVGVFAAFAAVFASIASVGDNDIGLFVIEFRRVLGHPDLGSIVEELWNGHATPHHLIAVWALIPTLGLVLISASFIVGVVLVAVLGLGGRWICRAIFVLLVVAAAALWVAADLPVLSVLMVICAVAALLPAILKPRFTQRSSR